MRRFPNTPASFLGGASLVATLLLGGCGGSDGPATPTPTPTPVVSLSGLVLLMHFDEPVWSGTAQQVVDSSGLGHHGTVLGGATSVPSGRFGRAGSFGTTGGVRIDDAPDLRPTTQLTVSAWVNPTALGLGTWRGILAKRVDYQVKTAYSLYISADDRLSADVDTEDNRLSAPSTLTTNNRWYHLAMTFDGTLAPAERVNLYVDGQRVATAFEGASSIQPFDSPLWIGCLPLTTPAQGFNGLVDEVAIWHRALSAQEISRLSSATTPLSR